MAAKFILDISRLFSRRHFQHDTGIDRVERGFLEYFREQPNTVFLLKYAGYRFFIGAQQLNQVFDIPKPEKETLSHKFSTVLKLRALAKRSKLSQVFSKFQDATYINVGHTGHPAKIWQKMRQSRWTIIVMIHDVIPLDFPEYSRSDKIETFRQKFENWCVFADLILAPSQYSLERVKHNGQPKAQLLHTPLFVPKLDLPNADKIENAWLIIGTIEPRKNHHTLFLAWEQMVAELGDRAPKLWIIGARGWADTATLNFLENSPLMGKHIFEYGALSDSDMIAKMACAKGLLFPSFCEGFGLPLFEASIAGKPIFASKIPAFEEALGSHSKCLVNTIDSIMWKSSILGQPQFATLRGVSSWKTHIETAMMQNAHADLETEQ